MSKASTYCIERIFLCIPHGGPSLYCFVLADSRTKTIYASVVEIVLYRFCFHGEWRRGVKKSAAHARIGVFNHVNSFFFANWFGGHIDRLYKSHISYFSANGVERGPNVFPAPAHWCLKSMQLIFFVIFDFGVRWVRDALGLDRPDAAAILRRCPQVRKTADATCASDRSVSGTTSLFCRPRGSVFFRKCEFLILAMPKNCGSRLSRWRRRPTISIHKLVTVSTVLLREFLLYSVFCEANEHGRLKSGNRL